MSTLKSIELLRQEKDALNCVNGSLIRLCNVRHAQTEEERSQIESYRADTLRAENVYDQLLEALDRVITQYGIERLQGKTAVESIEARLAKLQPELAPVELPF
jgi:hypothetical protein